LRRQTIADREVVHVPEVERQLPPYIQIANHYRSGILRANFAPGQRLPPIAEVAHEWHVANATAAKAMSQLQVEGAVYTTPRGTFVADQSVISRTPAERIASARREGISSETTVTETGIVVPPVYVAELLDLGADEQVIRREEIGYKGTRPVILSVDWLPALDVLSSAEMLTADPISGGIQHLIESSTGRPVVHGRDHVRGRAADAREAGALHLPIGSPILAGAHVWSDDERVILYGEWCLPPDQVVSWEYTPAVLQ
jgi:GntR family transcriptional regulator